MLQSKTHKESGLTLIEIVISIGVLGIVSLIGGRFISNSTFFSNLLQAKVRVRSEMSFLEHRINHFWNIRLPAGEPAPAPQPFDAATVMDKYFLINFRRDAITTVNFDKIRFQTQCSAIPPTHITPGFQFPEVCGITCPVGKVPYVFETFTYNGGSQTRAYPPRNTVSESQAKAVIGIGLCAKRTNYDEVQITMFGYRKIKDVNQPVQMNMNSMVLKTEKAVPGVELIYKP